MVICTVIDQDSNSQKLKVVNTMCKQNLNPMKHILFILLFVSISFLGISQNWVPLFTGSSLMVDADALKYKKDVMRLPKELVIKTSDWNGYLRNLVLKFPPATGDSILDGLIRFHSEWDKIEKMIRFEPDRSIAAGYTNHSFLSLTGSIKNSKIYPFVKFNYSGSDWIYANRIKMVCDDETFEFDSLKFFTHGTADYVSEYVLMVYNESISGLIQKIIDSNETIIRFYSDPQYTDFEVTERMKLDMKKFLKTIRALQ